MTASAQPWYLTNPELIEKKPAEYRVDKPADEQTSEEPTVEIPVPPAAATAPAEPDAPAETNEPAETPSPDEDEKKRWSARRFADRIVADARSWNGFNRQAMTLGDAWRESGVIDPRRIPAESKLLALFWWASNRTDRLVLFAILGALIPLLRRFAPDWVYAPLLWCAVRPSRRWSMYGVIYLITVILPYLVKG
jgi:hypothetical protein